MPISRRNGATRFRLRYLCNELRIEQELVVEQISKAIRCCTGTDAIRLVYRDGAIHLQWRVAVALHRLVILVAGAEEHFALIV